MPFSLIFDCSCMPGLISLVFLAHARIKITKFCVHLSGEESFFLLAPPPTSTTSRFLFHFSSPVSHDGQELHQRLEVQPFATQHLTIVYSGIYWWRILTSLFMFDSVYLIVWIKLTLLIPCKGLSVCNLQIFFFPFFLTFFFPPADTRTRKDINFNHFFFFPVTNKSFNIFSLFFRFMFSISADDNFSIWGWFRK